MKGERERETEREQNEILYRFETYELTGLAQRSVVRTTPIRGVTVTIFEVNFGKYSFIRTAKQRKQLARARSLSTSGRLGNKNITSSIMQGDFQFFSLPPIIVGNSTTWKVLIAKPCKDNKTTIPSNVGNSRKYPFVS